MDSSRETATIKKFNGQNFHIWGFQMKALFLGRELLGIIDGTVPKPPVADVAARDEWIKKDGQAISLLCSTIDDSILDLISGCTSSKDIWDLLKTVHDQRANDNIHDLQVRFYKCKFEQTDSIATFISKVEVIKSQLVRLGDLSIGDTNVIAKVLGELPDCYSYFHSSWDSTAPAERTLNNLLMRLVREELRQKDIQGREEQSSSSSAFVANSKQKSATDRSNMTYQERQQRRKDINERKKSTECWKCGKTGHWARECTEGDKDKKATSTESSSAKDSKTPHRAYMAFIGDASESNDVWIADSGCTDHMTEKRYWFADYKDISEEHRYVQGIGGIKLLVYGIGNVNIRTFNGQKWESAVLNDVMHVPGIGRNLFSVYKAALSNIDTVHSKAGCRLVLDGKTMISGVVEGTMYKLHIKTVIPTSGAYIANTFGTETKKEATQSIDVWHQRLCHLNHAQIRSMASQNLVEGLMLSGDTQHPSFCVGCVLGKIHRTPFPVKEDRTYAAAIGGIIHADVCGPMNEKTVAGAAYFVLFKDDYSHYRTVYIIKQKSEVFACLKKFAATLHNETGFEIQTLRSDRGGEFTGKAVTKFLAEKNIDQQLTCPYTPEQNGSAERENRTVVEAARSMIYSANVHLRFWGEAVATAVYTLNRTGNSTSPGITPFEKWHGIKPSVAHMKVFGADAYVHVPRKLRQKLDAKAKPGIFMGYSSTSKAY